jgi:hypothetical protein
LVSMSIYYFMFTTPPSEGRTSLYKGKPWCENNNKLDSICSTVV